MTAIRKYVFHDGKELELGKRTLVIDGEAGEGFRAGRNLPGVYAL